MKKIVALAVVILAVLVFAKYYQLQTVGILESNTYAVTDNQITQSLFSDQVPPEKAVLEPTVAESLTPLYELGGNLFLGERKNKLNNAYPLFVNDAVALMNVNNSAKLITEDFERKNTYYGLYVSDGLSFNADKQRADAETFILLELANKLYINARPMEVHTICGDVLIPMNGVVNFQEDAIRYYTLEKGKFHYKEIPRVDEQTWVRFAGKKYPYYDFLIGLGKLKEPSGQARPALQEEEAPPEIPEREEEEGKAQEEPVEPAESPVLKPEAPEKTKASFRKPRLSMTDFRVNSIQRTAETTLSIHDPSGVLTGAIQVIIRDEKGNAQSWTFTNYAEAQKGILQPVAFFDNLENGMTYTAYGTYSYIDADGQKQTEFFGWKTFQVEERLIYFFDLLEIKEEPEPEPEFVPVKPQVSCEPFVASIYDLHSTLTIHERGSLVTGGIRFEVYHDERMYMRKTVSASGELTLGPLPPATEFKIIGYITYLNEYKIKVEEKFFEQTIATLPLDQLEPMSLSFQNGKIFYDRIQIVDLCFVDDPADSNRKIGAGTIPYVAKIAVLIDNNTYGLKPAQISAMQEGGKVEYETPAVLRSNQKYRYRIVCLDRFGNELPLTEPAEGETHTCKAPPKAIIWLTTNEVANTELTVEIENKDHVEAQNYRIALYDINDHLIHTVRRTEGGEDSEASTHHDLPEDGGKITFTNLSTGEAYSAVVYADYDLDNGEGIQENMEIGRIRFTTLSISALGYAIFTTEVTELTDQEATLTISLDKNRTNPQLQFLLDKVTVLITGPDGEEIMTVSLTEEELARFVAGDGEPFQIELENLLSSTEYEITILAEVEQGGEIHDIKTSNSIDGFKTLKTEPEVVISSYFSISNAIELYDVIINDPDGAILSHVNLLVTDSYGRVVGSRILQANTLYETLVFPKLIKNEMYTFTFVATEFNKGYDYTTFETLYELKPVYQIINENKLAGEIGLQSLDEITGDNDHYLAKLRVQISDEKQLLLEEPRYTIKVFKEEEQVDALVYEIEPAGSDVDNIFTYQVDAMSEYRFELWVKVQDHELKLDETDFTTEQRIIGLKTLQDFSQLKTNPTGKYIVLNDIDLTSGPVLGWAEYFNGVLDFQGYTLHNNKGLYLISHLGKNGIIKNMVLDVKIPFTDPLRYRGFIVYVSQGTMENIMVNVKGCTEYLHNDWGIFCRVNSATSVIENFVVNLECPVYVWKNYGSVVPFNSGLVRNGYVYGNDIILPDIEVDGGYSASTFGGIVGRNETAGQVENVFNLVNIRTGTLVTPSTNNFGMIVGVNNGRVKNTFTTGEVYFGGANDLRYGPAVGSQGGMLQTAAYYISESSTYTNTYNAKVTKETLYDPLWHKAVLGDMFETEEPVLLGYYPQLKMPDCMPAQPYLPLPELDVANTVDLASVMVEEQYEDYAIARFTFNNPSCYTIKSVAVEYLDATIIEGSQVDKDELTRVLVRLDNPTKFYSSYNVLYFGYGVSASSPTTLRHYQKGERLVNAEFFKPIRTIEDWASIEDSLEQNYRLKEDLDFNNTPPQLIRIGENDANQFTGKLDGGIYDKNMKCIGMHTIRNLDLSIGLGGVITNLKGSVSNLRVERLILENPTDSYVGFVRHTQSGALVDNVHLSNVRLSGSSMVGGIAGQCNYANLQNCSVNGIIIKNATTTLTAGGLAGQGSYCMIKNCYVDGLNILIEKAKSGNGVGGIIGYIDNSEVENCYAVGSIETNVQNAGGIIGRAGSGNMIQKFWSDVDITTTVDYIAGIVGFYPGGESDIVPVNSLVLGDLYSSVSTAANVRRIMGNRTDMLNAYAWSGQRINGGIPYEADGVTLVSDGAEVLSGELLCDPQTYIKRILLGDSFDYGQVHNGVLPQLYDTNGELLPYQTEHKLDENPLISIKDVIATTVGNQHMIQVKLSHEAGLNIENVRFDYLNVNTQVVPESDVSTTLVCTVEGNPVRYLDSYQLNGITYNGGQVYKALAKVTFEQPFYIDIPDVATWQTVMAERKDNFENFRITGNLDFGNRADIIYNVNVNRIVGNLGAEGEYSVIRNIKIDFPETGQSFINTVNAGVSGLRFENISLTNKKAGGSYVGIIGNCFGNIEKVAFYNVNINGLSATQVGCIGFSGGRVSDVSIELGTIKSTGDYVGGLFGRAENVTLKNLHAKEIAVSGKNHVGGLAGYVFGDLAFSSVEDVSVTGTSNYVGGIAGYTYPRDTRDDLIINQGNITKNSHINGISYVGGFYGKGSFRNDLTTDTWSLVENTTIIGTGGYVGGIMGDPYTWCIRNGLVSNCKIFGGYRVGGGAGNSLHLYTIYVLDSVISTIYDPKYGQLTGNPVQTPTSSSQNVYIGGIVGYAGSGGPAPRACGVVNCSIGANGADYVGGIAGYMSSGGYNDFCLDSTVYGRNHIGGIVGYHRNDPLYHCQSNAEVIASGQNAGGIAGYMYINRDLDGGKVPRLLGNYYVGNVSAGDYAGGLVGRTSDELSGDNSRLIVAANVTANGSHGNIVGNLVGGTNFTYLRIYNNSVLNVEGAEGRKAAEIYAEEPQSSSGMMLVSTAQLKTATTYTSLGSYFTTTYRNYTSLNHNFMPYLRYSSATMPYQEGKDENGNYNPINSYLGGIPIPSEPEGDMMPMMMPLMATMGGEEMPVPQFYASGADKLNIEFGGVNEYTRFSVWANDTKLFEQTIGQRVYTLSYDYVTPLTVMVTDGIHSKQYLVEPEQLRRNVLTFNSDYYWITDLGVQSGKAGLLAGQFIHLYAGQGLTATGKLVDLRNGEVLKEKVEITLCEEVQPLYSFTYEANYRIKTYKNFSEINHDGETVTRDLQLLVKNGRLSALDPSLPIVYDGVIVDTVGDAEYLTVLGTDGKLADLKERIVLPQDFKNYNIVQMSHNLRTSSPYLVVRYKNGSVVAFNYLTGEELSTEKVQSDQSLIEYAKEFLQSKIDSVLADLSDGYLKITALQKQLTVMPDADPLANLNTERVDGENTGGTTDRSKDDLSTPGEESAEETNEETTDETGEETGEAGEEGTTEDGEETAEGVEEVTNEDEDTATETGRTEESAARGEVNQKDEADNAAKGEGAESQGIKDQGSKAHDAEGDSAEHIANERGGVSEEEEQTGELSSPAPAEPLVHRYIPVFDPKTGQYLLYDEKSLLEAPEESLTSVNERLKLEPVIVKGAKSINQNQPGLLEDKGLILLFLISLAILVLLFYLAQKKRIIK